MRVIILLSIFLMFVSFTASIAIKRNDPLTGFKQCDGDFPNPITLYSYSPNPVVVGQMITVRIGGEVTKPIEKGALVKVTIYQDKKELYTYERDYCKMFVEPSGSKCPVGKGHFEHTASFLADRDPSDPKHVEMEFGFKIIRTFIFFLLLFSFFFKTILISLCDDLIFDVIFLYSFKSKWSRLVVY
jgi:hypothetical protein